MQAVSEFNLSDDKTVVLRQLNTSDDLEALTKLLNRAYAPLAARGMHYVASWQDVKITHSRIDKGTCYVGLLNNQLVGTVTLCVPDAGNQNVYYHNPAVAYFQQFAVAPELQSCGLGSFMMDFLEAQAAREGYSELALDTSEQAVELIDYYVKRGYKVVAQQNWKETNYASLVLSKKLAGGC